ncbi:AraC family transcriptional regulator [Kitasatospora sp. NPDC059577]|uniref:AraC family transcriptional regulator n=1 Tax=Kitasatospora sp. NPDC059577 TaxID=3346873 RepID=UPI003676CA68
MGARTAGAAGAEAPTAGTDAFRSEDLPATERFDYWRELIGRTRDSEMTSVHAADFRADMRRLELGQATLLRSSFPPSRFRRSAGMVRRSDREVYHLTLVLDGALALTRETRGSGDRVTTFGAGRLYVVDSSHPYDVRGIGAARPGRGEPRIEALGIDFPAASLPLPPQRLREVMGRGFSRDEGTSALLADFLLGLDRQAALLGPAETPRLGTVVIDLVTAWLARELDTEAAVPDDARQRALVENVRTFVRRNLSDPGLTPTAIAAAHHVSVSYLHRLFTRHTQGRTLAGWIRAERLESARRDLADPALRTLPVHAVAARWGIPRASDFTRAFRAAYGQTPGEHRRQALAAAGRVA